MINSINPADNKLIKIYNEMSGEELSQIISLADKSYKKWKETEFTHRSELMRNAAKVLRKNSEEYSLLMTAEMGKPIVQSRAEVEKCAWVCDYFAENAEKLANIASEINGRKRAAKVLREYSARMLY